MEHRVPELVEFPRRLEPPLMGADLAQGRLGLLLAGPEIGGARLLPQFLERAPRGVEIKDSRGATGVVPRRP